MVIKVRALAPPERGVPANVVAANGDSGKPLVHPEGRYIVGAVLFLIAGAAVGIALTTPRGSTRHLTA